MTVAAPKVLGVVGAGTMGAGIAQLGAQAGMRVLLHDPDGAALGRGIDGARAGIAKLASKGRFDGDPDAAGALLEPAAALEDLAPCELIVEAAPERLELKLDLFAKLSAIAPTAVLASNTSSIPITAIARGAADPGLVVGLHFFNPPPLMKLVELIAAVQSTRAALDLARAAGEAMGKRVIDASDGPGFLVNRCNRPFGGEALRLVQDGVADIATIDAIVRGAGFRMGPFELQDLVGIDVGFTVQQSFYELSFGEPRWRPSPLSARLVAAGHLGRKTGQGWYAYDDSGRRTDGPAADAVPSPSPTGGARGLIVIAGDLMVAHELRDLATDAGWDVAEPGDADGEVPWLAIDCGHDPEAEPIQGAPQAILVADGSLTQLDQGGGCVGFHALPPLAAGGTVELTRGTYTTNVAAERMATFLSSLDLQPHWVGDAPGLVLGRIVCQLVNEAAFALQEGVTDDPQDIDDGLQLGLNHPHGAFAWGDAIGLDHVLMVLDALRAELGEERYRAAPLLRRMVAEGRIGIATGEGFHRYED
ncbi:Fatty acid oxidation complex subunit alpha [Paraconexibacter sp. AEG42_29]|uniref:Fatty acid oxidation complex subunit alpha n=1 Tax=Paraconexibacter sp. AEG42_29 TaxID=2997339 RepID=A0AAU7AY71_9ACTN